MTTADQLNEYSKIAYHSCTISNSDRFRAHFGYFFRAKYKTELMSGYMMQISDAWI